MSPTDDNNNQDFSTFNHVLVVDDDEFMRVYVARILSHHGYKVEVADSGQQALEVLKKFRPDLIILDVVMPGLDGFETLKQIRRSPVHETTPVIFVTAVDSPDTIYQVFEHGETDYVGKPVRENELLVRVRLHLNLRRQASENDERVREILALRDHLLTGKLEQPEAFKPIVTRDVVMFSLFQYVEAIAVTSWPVLITGETGTGKELVARAIHSLSGRPGDFVAVNVAGLDDNVFADTLFGHARGAFTGAETERSGLIERASKGTLFLDEIGDLEPSSQVKLLRLLQEREYYPLGSDVRKMTDARILVATNRSLEHLMADKQFRDDLYYRLRTHHVHLPPLRERQRDMPMLVLHFIEEAARHLDRSPPEVGDDLMDMLTTYSFPGNIRELESMIMDAVSRSPGDELDADVIKSNLQLHGQASRTVTVPVMTEQQRSTRETLEYALERDFPTLREMNQILIDQALDKTDGNQTEAAKLLGISRQALNKRLRRSEN